MYKQSVVQPYHRIPLNSVKEWTIDTNTQQYGWIQKAFFLVKGVRQKATYCMIPSIWHPGKGKTTVTESRSVVTRGWVLGRIWLPKGVRGLEGWGNCSVSWLWYWLNDCMLNIEEMNFIICKLYLIKKKTQHRGENHRRIKSGFIQIKLMTYLSAEHGF